MTDDLDYRRWLADGGETDEFRNDPRVPGWQQRYNNESRRVMGSENNMVAVLNRIVVAHNRLRRSEITAQEFDEYGLGLLARLASAQPDAQQGEGLQHVAYFDEGEFHWMSGIAPRDCELYAKWPRRAATPSSPALDAATIERCAQVADDFQGSASLERCDDPTQATAYEIAAAIRALPNAEKRHG